MRPNRAFTLVEILIVVVILAIVAAIVVPKFSNASAQARGNMLIDHLRIMRTQLEVFRAQHLGTPAGYPDGDRSADPTEAAFVLQMTLASDRFGKTATPGTAGHPYGPYFSEVPINPVNGLRTVQVIADAAAFPAEADDSHGWIYQPRTGLFRPDCTGADEKGASYFEY